MNQDNETYLKLFGSNHQKQCLFTKKVKVSAVTTTVVVLFCLVATMYIIAGVSIPNQKLSTIIGKTQQQEYPLRCTKGKNKNETQTCPRNYYPTTHNPTNHNNKTCPSYFRWIHEDLKPWKEKGITREMLEGARRTAHFRLVILEGKVYVENYRKSIQTRDVFTLWGILQLLGLYPGKLPDLELMFDCDDRPVIHLGNFQDPDAAPPPLFRYCSDQGSLDIVFPDWSFWGWVEKCLMISTVDRCLKILRNFNDDICYLRKQKLTVLHVFTAEAMWAETNIKPWGALLKDIKEGNKRTKWKDRVPYAYWKGNPYVAETRKNLLKCNVTSKNDWNTRLYIQDWKQESNQGYKKSSLADQCTHRYKIYIEGWAWSVSEKYILACDSMTLYVRPKFHDFFVRGMEPLQHYWPIRDNSKCTSLKYAVEWGNNHTDKAQAIGEAASKFIQEDLDMDFIYDYMFHLLNEYAKLLRFKPTIPQGAVEFCPETMACAVNGTHRRFMEESMVKLPSDSNPCTIPPPYDPLTLQGLLEKKANSTRQVEIWEDEHWLHKNKGK